VSPEEHDYLAREAWGRVEIDQPLAAARTLWGLRDGGQGYRDMTDAIRALQERELTGLAKRVTANLAGIGGPDGHG
jgi:hypothetical protein